MAHPTYQAVWTYLKRSVGLRGDTLKREFRKSYADKLKRHLDQQGVNSCRFHRWSWQSITLEDAGAGIDSDTPELEGASSRHRAFYLKRKEECKELGKTIANLVRYVKDNQGRMNSERRKFLADCCRNLFENQSTYLPSCRHAVGGSAKFVISDLMRTQTIWVAFTEFYFFCPSCNEIFSVDDGVEVDGRMYCQDCADRDFERCGDCLTHMAEHAINYIYVGIEDDEDADCRHVCSRCVRNGSHEGRYWLWETGHWHEIEETAEVHADRYAENGTINDYGSAAPVRFDAPAVEIYQPSVDNTQTLADSGFELEWIPKEYGSARNVARRLWRDCWADMGGLERDGSIRSWDGAEIVSHYGPLPRVRDAVKNVAKVLREFNARSHTTPSGCKCGFHVSLSRPADSRVTARLVCFWNNPANREFLKTFTRRWNVSYCKANNAKGDTQRLKNSELYADSLLRNSDRYELINLQNRNRIEIRAFRGSTKTDTLLACLDIAVFGLAYCEMTEDPMYLNADDFCRWMKSLSGEVVPSYALAKLSF